jgi:hypothetical protein
MKLAAALLLVAAGCGGAEAAPREAAPRSAIACDWCPGLPAAMQCEYTLGGVTMHVCRCAEAGGSPGSLGSGLVFRVDPPLGECAAVQVEWAKACPTPVAYTPHAACP